MFRGLLVGREAGEGTPLVGPPHVAAESAPSFRTGVASLRVVLSDTSVTGRWIRVAPTCVDAVGRTAVVGV